MEKKNLRTNQNLSKCGQQFSDQKKNQDASSSSTKWPKQSKRRESQNSEPLRNNSSKQSKNRNGSYDKRPRARGPFSEYQSDNNMAVGEGSGLAELNSVFSPGSKKQNLNHLLNFHFYSPKDNESPQASGVFAKNGYHRSYAKKYRYNKEQYLQANCQFVVKANGDYRKFTVNPDDLVDWESIVKVIVSSSEEAQCPICLFPPAAAQLTRCGHVFCFSCMLHYLSLSDKTWRKCPICFESVHLNDLKSTVSKQDRSYKIGDIITMELMSREKGSLYVTKANEIKNVTSDNFPSYSEMEEHSNYSHSKLIIAKPIEVLKIIEQEMIELEFQLIENGINCPESIFVQQAMDLLRMKQQDLEKSIAEDVDKEVTASHLNICAQEFVPKADASHDEHSVLCESRHELIDEICNLTLNDIDIVPTATAAQSKHFYYYQAPNAQHVFLHSINSRMLQLMYGSLDKSPQKICGRIVQIECCSMNEDLRKRLKYLQHLPVSSVFEVVEIEFPYEIVTDEILYLFKDELSNRRKIRNRRDRDERIRERQINEINDRQMGKVMSRSANIHIESTSHFPVVCGSFESMSDMPLLSSSVSERSSSPGPSSPAGPSFARMLTTKTATKSEKLWPTLASSDELLSPGFPSYFGNQKMIHVTGNKSMLATPQASDLLEEDEIDDDEEEKVPVYKNNLGDALANALANSAYISDPSSRSKGKKKKAKKTILFASGMNFN